MIVLQLTPVKGKNDEQPWEDIKKTKSWEATVSWDIEARIVQGNG